jgi:hypothetical protein
VENTQRGRCGKGERRKPTQIVNKMEARRHTERRGKGRIKKATRREGG